MILGVKHDYKKVREHCEKAVDLENFMRNYLELSRASKNADI